MALGKGSPIDAAKIIAHDCGAAALIAVPTTAGTGSEGSGWSVISDSLSFKSLLLTARHLVPAVQKIFTQIRELSKRSNLNTDTLKKLHLELIVENSLKNINIQTNPRRATREDLMDLLGNCFRFI